MSGDPWPIASTYKGVGIHAGQSAKRVAHVKAEIDRVSKTGDLLRLYGIAGDCSWSPEARVTRRGALHGRATACDRETSAEAGH